MNKDIRTALGEFFKNIKLNPSNSALGEDKSLKIRQILDYLKIMDAQLRKLSSKRTLILVDSGAGNCYLSFLASYYYREIDPRPIQIHCIDWNNRLMEEARATAARQGLDNMVFHSGDILEFDALDTADLCYSLHACDTATDAALALGVKLQAKCILSASCCQNSLNESFRMSGPGGLGQYKALRKRFLYQIADGMRAQLLEHEGYKAELFDFTSSRNTDKNLLLRARKGNAPSREELIRDYRQLSGLYRIRPALEEYLGLDLCGAGAEKRPFGKSA